MKKLFYSLVLIMQISMVHAQTKTDNKEKITWYINSFPPYIILEGTYKNQGILEKSMNFFEKNIAEFSQERMEVSLNRAIESIKTKPNACNPSLLKTPERELMMEFSQPIIKILPNGLITTKDRLQLFKPFINANGELKLKDFLNTEKYRLGMNMERSYGANIDETLKKANQAKTIIRVPSTDVFATRLQKLVTQKEFDAMIGYAVELKYTIKNLKLNEADLAFLPIEGEPDLLSVSVACSKTPQGKSFINTINKLMLDTNTQREFANLYRQWLDDATALRYDRLIKNINQK